MKPFLAVLTAALLSACVASSFSSLQSEYDTVARTRADCKAATERGNLEKCPNDESVFVDIARRARETAGKAGDERTRIGLLRLAATAGWSSRVDEGFDQALAAAQDGESRCDKLPSDRFGAPRDCALLRLAPAFVEHQRAVALLDQINTGVATPQARREALARIGRGYSLATVNRVERVRGMIAKEASKDIDSYVERQLKALTCTLFALGRQNAAAGNVELGATLQKEYQAYAPRYVKTPCT